MIEIRPIRSSEADEFVALLCTVFNLDLKRARSVFFSEPFFDLNRKWALFEDGEIRSILTTTPLLFGWGRAYGIAGVATAVGHRGRGLAAQLLERVWEHGEKANEGAALLFAHRTEVYCRVGFEVLDEVIRAEIASDLSEEPPGLVGRTQAQAMYDAWASKDPNRLRRDAQRWSAWHWVLRICEEFGSGYLCVEGSACREAIPGRPFTRWPVPPGTTWLGLKSLTHQLRVPIGQPHRELIFMGRGFAEVPQMFMTDQF